MVCQYLHWCSSQCDVYSWTHSTSAHVSSPTTVCSEEHISLRSSPNDVGKVGSCTTRLADSIGIQPNTKRLHADIARVQTRQGRHSQSRLCRVSKYYLCSHQFYCLPLSTPMKFTPSMEKCVEVMTKPMVSLFLALVESATEGRYR